MNYFDFQPSKMKLVLEVSVEQRKKPDWLGIMFSKVQMNIKSLHYYDSKFTPVQ